ncbi:MAG: class I SAM-dependent methyltransferase [Isosphaeraceae bacterium]
MIGTSAIASAPSLACPACRAPMGEGLSGTSPCRRCDRHYPEVAGLPDFRLASDRYLGLDAERAKASRLHALEPTTDVMGLASAYYEMTEDVVDRRRERFLSHIAGALPRGEAIARRLPREGNVLEVGCGTGGLLVAAARRGRDVTGVEIASRWLVVARRRLSDHGLRVPLLVAEAERLPWPDASFACVVADSLIEHLDDPSIAFREWVRVLKPGGTLLLWSPNRFSIATDPHLGLWGLGWLPRAWVPSYLRLRGKKEWPPRTRSAAEAARLAREAGYSEIALSAPGVDASWASTRPPIERRLLKTYASIHQRAIGRACLRRFGPLWELRAIAGTPR